MSTVNGVFYTWVPIKDLHSETVKITDLVDSGNAFYVHPFCRELKLL